MPSHQRFSYRELADLRRDIVDFGLDIPLSEEIGILHEPLALTADSHLPNRFIVHPMEGFDSLADGSPGPLSFRRYRRYAEGGSALIWFEATAVLWEARSNPGQLWLHEDNVAEFARLVAETKACGRERHGHEPVMILQLTHSGRYSKPAGIPKPLIAHHSPILDPQHHLPEDYPLLDDEYLDRLQDTFVAAAKLAAKAGFDGVDIKSCHRYLIAELHASFTRRGRYGGSFENRTRLLRETLARIQSEATGLFVTTRLNAYDAIRYPYGFGVSHYDYRVPDLSEPIRYVGILKEMGAPLLNISIGNPYFNPHFGRPYDFPIAGVSPPAEHPLVGIARFLGITRTLQEHHPDLPIVGSGYSWLRQFMPYVAAGVLHSGGATLIGQGRGAFAYPDSPNDLKIHGAMDPRKCCVTCSGCTQIMRDGGKTGCVLRDADVYGPQYRLGRRYALDRLRQEVQRCRECVEATCSAACPAGVDVPGFLKAFAEGDIAGSYAILRRTNVLPEMCGYVCPADEQCQGHCVETIFEKRPLPIQDIQTVVSRTARLQGITGLKPGPASGKHVAVVGGGPTGIAGAVRLLEAGHQVTIIEKATRLGGTPDAVIPETRYADAQAEIKAIIQPALDAGRLHLHLQTALGESCTLESLRRDFDAVLVAVGLRHSVSLGTADGVTDAITFLRAVKQGRLTTMPPKTAILGAGNTAMDAASTAIRLGSRDVYVIYRRSFAEMPAWKQERDAFLEAGGHILLFNQPLGYETDHRGRLTALRVQRTELGEADESGRRRPVPIENSEFSLAVDMVIEAMGQAVDANLVRALKDLRFTERNLLAVDDSFATNVDGVYAAGDAVNGGTTAVQGIAEAMRAAVAIDRRLTST